MDANAMTDLQDIKAMIEANFVEPISADGTSRRIFGLCGAGFYIRLIAFNYHAGLEAGLPKDLWLELQIARGKSPDRRKRKRAIRLILAAVNAGKTLSPNPERPASDSFEFQGLTFAPYQSQED